ADNPSRGREAGDQEHEEQHEEQAGQKLRNRERRAGDGREAEKRREQTDHQEYQSHVEHDSTSTWDTANPVPGRSPAVRADYNRAPWTNSYARQLKKRSAAARKAEFPSDPSSSTAAQSSVAATIAACSREARSFTAKWTRSNAPGAVRHTSTVNASFTRRS